MQTKHLHLLLLFLLLTGCTKPKVVRENPYLADKSAIDLVVPANTPPILWLGSCELRVQGYTVPAFRMRLYPQMERAWEVQWENERQEPLALPHQITHRTLASLVVRDSLSELTELAIPLPRGEGSAFYLESRVKQAYALTLSAAQNDTLWTGDARKLGENLYGINVPGGGVMVVGTPDAFTSVTKISAAGKAPAWRFVLKATREPQLLVSIGATEAAARRQTQYFLNAIAEVVHARTVEEINHSAAFQLCTESDTTNRTYALLAAALTHASARLKQNTHLQIEDAAQSAAALYLASRARPETVFPGGPVLEQQQRDNLRWGSASFGAALNWGMAGDDTLRRIADDVIKGLVRLQREYSTSDLEAAADPGVKDSLMRVASAHVRLAGLLALAEDISYARGDREAQGSFRSDALRAGRRARQAFNESARMHIMSELEQGKVSSLESILDTTGINAPPDTTHDDAAFQLITYPDTALFLAAGARYGFGWLSDTPLTMWNPRLALGAFTWQRWIAFRCRSDLRVVPVADLDSLGAMLWSGPLPGLLTTEGGTFGEPSLLVMAAAFQNLAEIYLGVKPQALDHKVFIEPRFPTAWGHTAARVPFGPGFLELDYHFPESYAVIGVTGVPFEVSVYFGYPLENGGFERAQFTLEPGRHPQRIELVRERGNRISLQMSEVP